jgi:hypothetical protein
VDFDEVFSPVVKWSTIRTLATRAAQKHHEIHHLDVKTAFLCGHLHDEVYMDQPAGYEQLSQEHLVCKLQKALYGLRQSPRMWYNKIDSFLKSIGMTRSHSDYNMYHIGQGDNKIILVVYIDGLFITKGAKSKITWLKQKLKDEFDMSDLGLVKQYLEVEFHPLPNGLFLTQQQYSNDMLQEFGMLESRREHTPLPASTVLLSDMHSPLVNSQLYCHMVDKLIFLTTTRHDLAYAMNSVSRYMAQPQSTHMDAVKHILRYVKQTIDYGFFYYFGVSPKVHGFTDVDWIACPETHRSTGGFCFTMFGSAIT